MNLLSRIIIFLCLLHGVIIFSSKGQSRNDLDSLKNALLIETTDSAKLDIYNQIIQKFIPRQPDSMIYYAMKNFDLYNGLSEAEKENKLLKSHFAECSFNLALAYSYKRKMDTSIALIKRPIALFKSLNDSLSLAKAYKLLAIQFFRKGDTGPCIAINDSAIAVYDALKKELLKSRVIHNKAQAYKQKGDYPVSLELYLEALRIKKELGADSTSLTNTLNEICNVHFLNNDFNEAEKYCLEALNIRRITHPESAILAGSILNMGVLYTQAKNYDKAIQSFEESIEMVDQNSLAIRESKYGDQVKAIAINNLAELYNKIGNLVKAEEYILKSIELTEKVNDPQTLAMNYNIAGSIAIKREQFQKAIRYLKKSLMLSQESESLKDYRDGLRNISNAYSQLENYKESLRYHVLFKKMNDSLYNLAKSEQITEINTKYETEKKDRQIAVLELDQQKAEFELTKSKNLRNIFIVSTLFILIVAILFYLLFIQKKRSLSQRETLLKEIHHRVKNNLQVISSLLNLQAGSLEDETAIDAVKEGQNRVKSMALIHQRLYSADDVRGVDVQEYLENLTKELFSAFGVDDDRIESQIDSNGLKLDIDTVIPLGLIINELITNTLKYAFQENEKGLLAIQLREQENQLKIQVKDNGKGMDEEALKSSNSFGWKMINSLGRKLKAEISVVNQGGTLVELSLSRYKLVV